MDGSALAPRPQIEAPPSPSNVAAEQMLLGALLCVPAQFERCSDFLRPEHFGVAVHGRIFAAIRREIEAGRKVNQFLFSREFDADPDLTEIGGHKYLARLAGACLCTVMCEDFAREIIECAQQRAIQEAAAEIRESAQAMSAATLAGVIDRKLQAIVEQSPGAGPMPLAVSARRTLEAIEARYKEGGRASGVPTGLADLDRLLGGLMAGKQYVLGGRPSMGKSAIAGTIAFNAAAAQHPVALFTLEMSWEQWNQRFLARLTGVGTNLMEQGRIDGNDLDRLTLAASDLEKLPIDIVDRAGIGTAYIRARCERLKRKNGLGLVIIDYLQLMSQGGRYEKRQAEVAEISRVLKSMARDLEVPVLLLAQLNRGVEGREDKRPTLADLRDAGEIEQDADVVMFAYREEYYLSRAEPSRRAEEDATKFGDRLSRWEEASKACQGLAELNIQKNRGGPIGTVKLYFDPVRQVVTNLAAGRA